MTSLGIETVSRDLTNRMMERVQNALTDTLKLAPNDAIPSIILGLATHSLGMAATTLAMFSHPSRVTSDAAIKAVSARLIDVSHAVNVTRRERSHAEAVDKLLQTLHSIANNPDAWLDKQ